ncbi:hypothetical protein Tco_0722403, partial [Tanacetum coccineum]
KATKQSKPLAPKAASVTKPAAVEAPKPTTSQPSKPTPATTEPSKKDQSKKCTLVKESSEAPSPAKRPKAGVPDKEPVYGDEEVDTQRAIEESLKEGKGKEKVSDKQVALDLLTLQTPKKKSPVEQYIFQRRNFAPTEPSGHDESSSLYAKLGLTNSETESNEELPRTDAGDQDEGQAGPNPGIQDEGQVGSNPGDAAVSQPQSSHVVHVEPNCKHIDFEVTDTSIQQNPEQMDEEFTTTAYPNVQENLKLLTEDQVRLEEPASSVGTLSSLQNLDKEISFTDQFLVEKSQEDEPEKTNTKSEVQSMVTVPIHQDTSFVPLMTTSVIDLTVSQPVSTTIQAPLPTLTTTVSKAVDEIVTDAVDWAMQAPLRDRFKDFPEADMKEILHHRMWETKSYEAHEDHKKLYEALEKKKKRRHESPKTPPVSPPHQPPPPPPPAGPSGTSGASGASGSSQLPPLPPPPSTNQSDQSKSIAAPSSLKTSTSAEYTAWTTTNTRLKQSVSSIPEDLHMDADSTPDEQVHSSDDEDFGNDHIPKASALASTYAPPPENSLLTQTGDMAIFMDWFCKKQGITKLTQKDLEGPVFEIVKVFHPNVIHLQYQMEECHKLLTDQVDDAIIRHNVSKPLLLGGQPGQVTIQADFFFNKDLEYLRYGSKGGRTALSISKMKTAYYPDIGLEQMVPDHMWIEEECKHISEGDLRAVQTHMPILSVVRIEVFSLYGYVYMKTIVLRRADLNEYIIAERDFKYLYPSDFKDLYLLNLQGHLKHLPPQDKKILSTAIILWIRNLVIRQRVEDFQLGIESYQTQLNLTKPR